MEHFDALLSETIDSTLDLRCKCFGYQYSEIIRSSLCVYFCGDSCVEDVSTHLMPHLSLHPVLRTCSSDTILRAIRELSQDNISYTSDSGKVYGFNTAHKINELIVNSLLATGGLEEGLFYDPDFDHLFIETEKYDAEPTYKKFLGYGVGVAVIEDMIVGIEAMEGNTNVHFHRQDTLKRIFERLGGRNIHIDRFRADCGYRCILTNDLESSEKEIVIYYNRRRSKERILDEMNNGFGWNRMPKSFMRENAVFPGITALIHNFYRKIMKDDRIEHFGLKKNNRIKAFVFKFISVPAKWIRK